MSAEPDFYGMFDVSDPATSILSYLNAVSEALAVVDAKLDKIMNAEFESGVRALEQALRTEARRPFLFEQAYGHFNKALSFEKGLKLAYAHLGLAVCHTNLGDVENGGAALEDLLAVESPVAPEDSSVKNSLKAAGPLVGGAIVFGGPLAWGAAVAASFVVGMYNGHRQGERQGNHRIQAHLLEELQNSVRAFIAEYGSEEEEGGEH